MNKDKWAALLITSLKGEDAEVRFHVECDISELGPAAHDLLPALTEALENGRSPVRSTVSNVLRYIGGIDEAAISALIKATEDGDPEARGEAAFTLTYLGCENALPVLIRLLKDDVIYVRRRIAEASGFFARGSTALTRPLTEALHDKDWLVRFWAAKSLGDIGMATPDVLISLIATLQDENEDVAKAADLSITKILDSTKGFR